MESLTLGSGEALLASDEGALALAGSAIMASSTCSFFFASANWRHTASK